jgi:hypothetical protein
MKDVSTMVGGYSVIRRKSLGSLLKKTRHALSLIALEEVLLVELVA